MSPSITTHQVPSFGNHNAMAVEYREILRLMLQMWAAELVAELVTVLSFVLKSIEVRIRKYIIPIVDS